MKGVICRRHVLAHPWTTVRCFGWAVFFRALTAGSERTFLSLVAPSFREAPLPEAVSSFIERCIALEQRAAGVYERLARQFAVSSPMARFFGTLVRQERAHAELLEICRGLAGQSNWRQGAVERWREAVPRLEQRMAEVEGGLEEMTDPVEALRLVIEIEGSEINSIFREVVSSTDSEFVRTFQQFQNAEAEHLDFICNEVPRLEVALAEACADLRASHP